MASMGTRRFRVRSEGGAIYGDFGDYEGALGQAQHMTDPRRRLKQSATVEEAMTPGGPWRQVITLEAGGRGPALAVPRVSRRQRLSPLAA